MKGPFAGRQVVMLASVDWSAAWQRHHAFAASFAAQGAEVFFVENTGFRDLRLDDLARVGARLKRLLRRGRPRSEARPKGLRVISPLVLPPTEPAFRALNSAYFLPWLAHRLRRRGLKPGAVVIAYLPTATTLRLLELLEPEAVVYDCVDNFAGHPTPPADLSGTEDALLARADAVLTTSRYLYDEKTRRHPNVHLIHHGASEAFLGRPRRQGPVRSLCYFGTLWSALDYEAVAALAEAGYAVTLAGPVKEEPPELPPGVTFAPAMPHRALPDFLRPFDALLLPYGATEYNKGVVPAKLYECLATGKPVLASALPSLKDYAPLLYTARRAADFPKAAAQAALDTAEDSARRIASAREHTTAAQARRVGEIVAAAPRVARAAPPAEPDGGTAFVRGLSWIGAAFAAARLATFAVQFVGARILGPAAYGTAHMVAAVAAMLQVAPMLGFPLALSHFTASADDDRARGRLVATGLSFFAAWALLCAAAGALVVGRLGGVSGLPVDAWVLAGVLALATAVHHATSSALQGLGRFRDRGAVEALYGAATLAALAAFLAGGGATYKSLLSSYVVGLAAASAASLALLFGRLKWSFDAEVLGSLLPYAGLGTAQVVAAMLVMAPGRLVTFHLHDAAETGRFSAYFSSTVQVALAVSNILQTVILPLASRPEGRAEARAAVRSAVPAALLAGWALFSAGAVAALTLLGPDYPREPLWIVAFGAAAALVCAHGAAAALFSAGGVAGMRVAAAGTLGAGIGNALFNILLTPRFGTAGAALSLCLGYGLSLAWFMERLRGEDPA